MVRKETIQTVRGPIRPHHLETVLTHEHLTGNSIELYIPPPKHLSNINDKLSLENRACVRDYPYSNKYNLNLNDMDAIQAISDELKSFYKIGGRTIVENTSHGFKRNVSQLKKFSEDTEVDIIVGTGFYAASVQPSSVIRMTQEEIYNVMQQELQSGCLDCPEVLAGHIGEIGSSWPIDEFERRVICAAADAQRENICPVSFHAEGNAEAPLEVMRLYEEAGGNARFAAVSHLEYNMKIDITNKYNFIIESNILDYTDCYWQLGLFGAENIFNQFYPKIDMTSDLWRIEYLMKLKEENYLDRILLSHDIRTNHRMEKYGGHGYSYIGKTIEPALIKRGFTSQDIYLLTVLNPRKWISGFIRDYY